jgi:uncharacterized protein (TIGR02271 family)
MSPVPDNPTVVTSDGLTGVIESEASSPSGVKQDLQVLVTLADGRRVWVPAEALILQADGQYRLRVPLSELETAGSADRPTVLSRSRELEERLADLGLEHTRPAAPAASEHNAEHHAPPPQVEAQDVQPRGDAPDEAEASSGAEAETPAPVQPSPGRPAGGVRVSKIVQAHKEDIEAELLKETVDVHRVPVNEYVNAPPEVRYEGDSIIIPVLEEVLIVNKRLLLKEEVVVTRRREHAPHGAAEVRSAEDVFIAPLPSGGEERYNSPGAERPYQAHYAEHLAGSGYAYEYFEPAYDYGRALRASATGQARQPTWDQLEPEARRAWEQHNPGTWDTVRAAVREAWSA